MYRIYICVILLICVAIHHSNAQIEGIYCGKQNCYDVLGVTRDDEKATIMKAYRRLARVHHPDRQKTVESKEKAEKEFKIIVTAYDILKDEEQRKEYDYMLDNPEAMYYHFYQYFKRRLGPQVDVRLVLAVFFTLVSIAQYYHQWTEFHDALDFAVKQPRFRNEAKEYAIEHKLFQDITKNGSGTKGAKKMSRSEVKACEEQILRNVIGDNKIHIKPWEIKVGNLRKPSVFHTLWIQIFTKPVEFARYIAQWCRWIVQYYILRRELTQQDRLEQIRYNLSINRDLWNDLTPEEVNYYVKRELWKKDKYAAYAEELDLEKRRRQAEDTKYKRHQRLMKKGGPGQITFGPDE